MDGGAGVRGWVRLLDLVVRHVLQEAELASLVDVLPHFVFALVQVGMEVTSVDDVVCRTVLVVGRQEQLVGDETVLPSVVGDEPVLPWGWEAFRSSMLSPTPASPLCRLCES